VFKGNAKTFSLLQPTVIKKKC